MSIDNIISEQITKLISECTKVEKKVITEGFSQELYHFTTLQALCKILGTNKIKLTMQTDNDETFGDKKRFFYLSCSRTKNFSMGYQNSEFPVRIKLNTQWLKDNGCTGEPISWYSKNAMFKHKYSFRQKQKGGDFEFEDRVYCKEPYLEASKAIESVDIIKGRYDETSFCIAKANELGIPLKVYNSYNKVYKNKDEMTHQYGGQASDIDTDSTYRSKEVCLAIIKVLCFIYKSYGGNDIESLLNRFSLGEYVKDVKAVMNTMSEPKYKARLLASGRMKSLSQMYTDEDAVNTQRLGAYILRLFKARNFDDLADKLNDY